MPQKSSKKENASHLIFHQNWSQIKKYGFVWFVKKSGRQMIQCSRIKYEEKDYYNIDIESLFFECENCMDDV